MGFAEDRFFDYLRKNLNLLNQVDIREMLNCLRGAVSIATGEQLDRTWDRAGNLNTRFDFLNYLQKTDDWVNHFLRALWECEKYELFETLQNVYRSYRPRRVWEPDPPPYSLPDLPNNNNELRPLDSPQRCVSLPPGSSHSFPEPQLDPPRHSFQEPQPGPPVARSPNQVPPEQLSRWGHPPQERSGPSIQPGAPMSQNPPPAPVLAPPASSPDQVDSMTLEAETSTKPVPESSPYPPPHVGSQTETSNSPDHSLPFASSLPARSNISMTQPLQEKPENREVAHTAEQPTSVVYTPRKDSFNQPPYSPVSQEVAGSHPPNSVSSPPRSVHEENQAWTAPQPRELPGPSQGNSNRPAEQHFEANSAYSRQPVESPPNSENSSPSPRQSVLSLGSAAHAGLGHNDSEPSPSQASVQPSSCRPTNVDRTWIPEKPGVLMSSAGFAAVARDTDEIQPLSRAPVLEISDDESSDGPSRSSGSSQTPSTRDSNGRQNVATTSTPKKENVRSSPKKHPEENEEPRGVTSSAYGRPPNPSPIQEAEENSFELSNNYSYYRLRYNEDPRSMDLLNKNSLPYPGTKNPLGSRNTSEREASDEGEEPTKNPSGIRNKSEREAYEEREEPTKNLSSEREASEEREKPTKNLSGIRNASEREASEEREKHGSSNLHNPVVITLSVVVVCLSVYIIWLKSKK